MFALLLTISAVDLVVCAGDPVENLVNAHLHQVGLAGVLARREDVFPPPKLLRQQRVPPLQSNSVTVQKSQGSAALYLGPLHVLVHQADRHEEVPLVAEDGPGEQHHEAANRRVLKI